ncbi:MAG: hypothetical protein A2V76_09755 [Candidatus Aminicenantes bacterium RBG_16_63_14]|nr:MAG: hypothetical protein A2V76_09755 [Candidatus Aminicenantes bacterium RBG_16_63_14]OGD27615.1 MAG: hypothetical protein A2V57_06410 [Candidatus Aminicenantes bacterium RBG_19FT_COMBO_65_30]
MNAQKPEYLRPALIVGAVAGLLSGLPFFGLFNCICCLWIVGGAAMAAKLLSSKTPGILKPSDGAIVGALTGIVAALVSTVLTAALKPDVETARRVLDWLSSLGIEQPSNIDSLLERGSSFLSPGWLLLGLFVSAAVYALMGVLGGIIGVSLFARKAAPPAPPTASGPSDAA